MDVDTESSNSPTLHEKVWYSDGNVVLATDTYLFKVHKDVLSLPSPVFRDMFELNVGEPAEVGTGTVSESYDDLPSRCIGWR